MVYGYAQGKIYFCARKKGKKVDFIKKNNRVCFEVKEWKGDGMSVICYGEVALRDDFGAKKKCRELLANQEALRAKSRISTLLLES
jgi:nitroimidazol reductase NimA-like FMN-containing flavoprotein (pyridoxamine 5'-phosphate oxidase superfamily)